MLAYLGIPSVQHRYESRIIGLLLYGGGNPNSFDSICEYASRFLARSPSRAEAANAG